MDIRYYLVCWFKRITIWAGDLVAFAMAFFSINNLYYIRYGENIEGDQNAGNTA